MMRKFLTKLKKDQRGLTLVELLAVVVILAIVAAIAFVLIGNVISNSKKDAHISNGLQIIAAVKLAEANGEVNETELTGAGADALSLPTLGSLVDPWGKKPYTAATVKKNGKEYSIVALTVAGGKNECDFVTNGKNKESDLQQGRDHACTK